MNIRLILFALLFTFSLAGCDPRTAAAEKDAKKPGANTEEKGPLTEITFATLEHDFGTIKAGQKVAYTYKFKNVGKQPLKIADIKTSCGCTSKNHSKEPVPAGQEGFVTLEFDSSGKKGEVQKSATVFANTAEKIVLRFKAIVEGA
jgi:hypothetical protein